MHESKGNIFINSPTGEAPLFVDMIITIKNKRSESKIVTEEEAIKSFYGDKESLVGILGGKGSYLFSTPTRSGRHYGELGTLSGTNGLPFIYINDREEMEISWWRVRIGVLIPIDDGFLSIECVLRSKSSEPVRVGQTEFFESLVHACETLIANADETTIR
jgi:hypothetical protein